ncbi:MAG: DUF4157 domain-containing protein [Cyanobacteria bacterium J06592_8]
MTHKFISRQSQSPTSSPPVQTSRFANRPFAEPVQQKAEQSNLQTILQRAERAGNPTAKMAWGNQPEVQRQGVMENETDESKVQQQATPEEQKDSEVQKQESEQKPEEETLQQQSSPESEQKDTEVQKQESEQKSEEETLQQQSTPEEQKDSEVQTKLTVGQPGDQYEKEADNVAAKVMTMPETESEENSPQSQDIEKEKSTVQTQPIAQSITSVQRRLDSQVNLKSVQDNKAGKKAAAPSLENRLASQKGGGSVLPEETRTFMEKRFGADFSEVRIHDDSQAAQMNQELGAQAFTHGNDIYFNSGKYDPSSAKGKELLAHELTHTVQQTGGKTAKSNNKKSSKANKVQMKPSMTPLAEPTIQRREDPSAAVPAVPTPSNGEGGTSDTPEATKGETASSAQTPGGNGSTPPGEGGGASSSGGGSSAPNAPEADPQFQQVVSNSKGVAEDQQQHEPAPNESQEAQNAAQSPSNEVESKAQDQQVGEMEQQQPEEFDPEAFKSAIFDKLKEITPKNEEEAHKFKENNQVDQVRNSVSSQVGDEQEQAAAPIEEKTDEEPDTSSIEPRQDTPMSAPDTGTAPGDVSAEKAAPKPKSEAEVSAPLAANSQELDQQMASENITDEQLAKSNESQFQTALDQKNKAQTDAVEAPKEYRQKEQQTIAQAKSEAQSTAANQTEVMHAQRQDSMSQVEGLQGQTKENDEQKRTEIADHINGIYERVKGEVDSSLSSLEQDVISKFDEAANQAKQEFENYVDGKLADYRNERYGTPVIGGFLAIKDWVVGLPDEINQFFEDGRQLYLDKMDVALSEIANTVSERLTEAKQKITEGRQEIKEYVVSLPEDLQHIGQEAASNIQSKFDDLEQQVQDKYDQLVDTLAERYRDRLQEVDDRIEEMKAENRGLIDKARDAIASVIKTIQEIKAMLEGILSKAIEAIKAIIQDPIGFLNNLIAGLRQGLENFLGNITDHLQSGLVGWLTGTMGSMGIEIPEDIFSLKGIFSLTTQILGLSWNTIRGKATKMFGEKTVTGMEESVGMVQVLRDEGPTGLWEQVQSDFGDLKESVMGEIKNLLIVQVIQAGVKWILGLLNPASAFVKAAMAIYDIIMFFVNQGSQVIELVNAVIDAVVAIAKGAVGGAAKLVENALVKALPVVIGFLASLLGIGGLAKKVQDIVEKVRKRIDDAIEKVLKKARRLFKKTAKKGKEKLDAVVKWWKAKKSFKNAGGEKHQLFFKGKDSQSKLMIASNNPQAIKQYLDNKEKDPNIASDSKMLEAVREARRIIDTKLKVVIQGTKKRTTGGKNKEIKDLEDIEAILTNISKALAQLVDTPQKPEEAEYNYGENKPTKVTVDYLHKDNQETGSIPGKGRGTGTTGWDLIFDSGLTKVSDKWVQMHIINENLGGKGIPGNLVPGPHSVNRGLKQPRFDDSIKRLIKKPENVVWIEADISYRSGTTKHHNGNDVNLDAYVDTMTLKYGLHIPKNNNDWSMKSPSKVETKVKVPEPLFQATSRSTINLNTCTGTEMKNTGLACFTHREYGESLITFIKNKRSFSDYEDLEEKLTEFAARSNTKVPEEAVDTIVQGIQQSQKVKLE